jgi:hypothetical protein
MALYVAFLKRYNSIHGFWLNLINSGNFYATSSLKINFSTNILPTPRTSRWIFHLIFGN